MVERPADVLPMTPANAPKLDWFTRADMALRRMPGFGVVLTVMFLEYQYSQGRIFLFALLLFGVVGTLVLEFWRNPLTTGSSPKSSGAPSAPQRRPDPA